MNRTYLYYITVFFIVFINSVVFGATNSKNETFVKEVYIVKSGDTLWDIGIRCKTTVANLRRLNKNARGKYIYPGQKLVIRIQKRRKAINGELGLVRKGKKQPKITRGSRGKEDTVSAKKSGYYVVRRGDYASKIARKFNISRREIYAWNNLDRKGTIYIGEIILVKEPKAYRVKKGDSLYLISRKFGKSIRLLRHLNPWIEKRGLLHPGDIIALSKDMKIPIALANMEEKLGKQRVRRIAYTIDMASSMHGVDAELIAAVAKVESNFNPRIKSEAGAYGAMQLMRDTARLLGYNRYNEEENYLGGAKYLKQMLERFDGDHELALAAYNAGPKAVERYNGVPPFPETQNYLKKIKEIIVI